MESFLLKTAKTSLLVVVMLCGARPRHCSAQEPASPLPEQPSASASAGAQTPAASPSVPNPPGKANANTNGGQPAGTSNDRLFFLFPNFLTLENASEAPTLTTAQKFSVVSRNSFDYAKYVWYGMLAGINQAQNYPSGFGQGGEGYGKRYGAALADSVIEDYMTSAILPSLLHQDPRYYQLGKGGFWHRTGYALSRTAITRSDSGRKQFNWSEIGGSGLAAGISTFSYYPKSNQNVSNVMSVWGTQLAFDSFVTVLKEFWPDIRRRLHASNPSPSTK